MENTNLLNASEIVNYSLDTHDIYWNADNTKFEPVSLRWTDNESYLKYQTANCIDENDHEGDFEVESESKEAAHKRLTEFEGLEDLDF